MSNSGHQTTYLQTLTATATETQLSTATETTTVLETALASCLANVGYHVTSAVIGSLIPSPQCKSSYWLTTGNANTYNTYATTSSAVYETSSTSEYVAEATENAYSSEAASSPDVLESAVASETEAASYDSSSDGGYY